MVFEWGTGLLLFAGAILSGWMFLGFLLGTVRFLLAPYDGGIDGSVALNCGVLGYLFAALVRRLLKREFAWPRPRLILANALMGYGRGWGVGVAILSSGVLAEALLSFGAPPKNGSYLGDAFFFIVVTILISVPGFIALVFGLLLRR